MTQTTTTNRNQVTEAQMSMAIASLTWPPVKYSSKSRDLTGVEYIVRYDRTHKALTCTSLAS